MLARSGTGRGPCVWLEPDASLDTGLRYLKLRFPGAEAWQVSAVGKKDYTTPEGVCVAPSIEFLSGLV